ncbi:MAG: heme o synthase [Salinigranum sp.]
MGVYLVLLVGGTTALINAASTCAAWPACGNGWVIPGTVNGLIAVGHRATAFVVGLMVVASAVLAWRESRQPRVKWALAVSALLYPFQAALGAVIATRPATNELIAGHVVLGLSIFAGLVAALAWTLEAETGDPDDRPISDPTDPAVSTDSAESPAAAVSPATDSSDAGSRPSVPQETVPRLKATAFAYFRLMKPRLMWLLCLVAAAAMALAGGPGFDVPTVLATLGGGVLSIGASGTFNHVFERDIDRKMNRTSDRPLAVDLVPVRHALAFGILLSTASLALFASVNILTAVLGLTAIVFYSVVYTLLLKPNTVQNTVIGGAAGALPALIGWVAVTGSVGVGGLLLAGVIFLWTPAHFYNLAIAYKDDYERGGFPMMPVVRGETETRKHILWYLGATFVAAGLLAVTTSLDWLYVATSVIAGGLFLWTVVRLHYEQTESAAFRAFHASNVYLGLLLLAVLVDAVVV